MKKILLAAVAVGLVVPAYAQIIETEPNNTPALANVITRGATPWSDIGLLSFNVAGDNDWFLISLFAGETITAVTTPLATPYTAPDTVMALIDPTASTVLEYSDDISITNRGSVWAYTTAVSGDFYIAIAGYHVGTQSDVSFYTESHPEEGQYELLVGIVPEPASLVAIGFGLSALAARRRLKK